jgi:hypothetical protein
MLSWREASGRKSAGDSPVIHFVLLRQEDFVLLVGHETFLCESNDKLSKAGVCFSAEGSFQDEMHG